MKLITDLKQNCLEPASVALGCFDGIHLGHQAVIGCAVADKPNGLTPSVFTFQENPLQVLTGNTVPTLLAPDTRNQIFEEIGVEQVFMPSFREVMNLEAEAFVHTVLKQYCKAEKVYCGFNFHFGKGGKAGSEELKQFGEKYGIEVTVVQAVSLQEGVPISSTQIRHYLQNGQTEMAAKMLGRHFCYQFPVIEGNKMGRTMGFPTINQAMPPNFVKPKRGVYASLVTLENGTVYYGVTNIGVKPTVGDDYVVASETWIPYFSGNLYGTSPIIELIHYIREEQKFSNLQVLGEQIHRDKEQAFQLLEKEFPHAK